MLGLGTISKKLFGSNNDRLVKSLMPLVDKVNALEPDMKALDDAALRAKTEEFRQRYKAGETLDDLLPEAFAVVREGAQRSLGMRPFDVQIIGGIILHRGNIAEMKTGEGKTLVATLPCYLNAISGKAVHVVTVNDYLARRDAEWMGKLHDFLGLKVGVVVPQQDPQEKLEAYKADITYATNNELGFDYLRDNLKNTLSEMVQRDHGFVVVDEVDSILIDEARTPLIISGPTDDKTDLYTDVDKIIPDLEESHYEIDEKTRNATLSEDGNEFVERRLHADGHLKGDATLWDPESVSLVHHVNQALRAHKLFTRDKDYIVRDDEVVLVDEFTGRMMTGRRLSEGLHQAIEAKENVKIQPENVTLASVTFQNYFRLYDKLAGMTGTALTEADEFQEIYGLGVIEVPTNLPVARADHDDQVYRTVGEKYEAIVEAIANAQAKGQPVLVGTTSIEKSELISGFLTDGAFLNRVADRLDAWQAELKPKEEKRRGYLERTSNHLRGAASGKGIPHQVLNARFHEQEAKIVALAGEPGTITIATNMAGRGTDIQLGGNLDVRVAEAIEAAGEDGDAVDIRRGIAAEIEVTRKQVLDAGGLFVLGTERHESRRIDNQLRGRSGRQGDPGKSRFYLSLEDDLMRIFGSERLDKMLQRLGMKEGEAIVSSWVNKALEKAQSKVEARNFDMRKNVLKYDDVMNDQRKAIFGQRREIMESEDVSDVVRDMRHEVADELVSTYMPAKQFADQWDTEGLYGECIRIFGGDPQVMQWAAEEGVDAEVILERLIADTDKTMAQKTAKYGSETWRQVEKQMLLQTIDQQWREHLLTLEHLRSVIGLRGYAQRDPLNEYKSEAFKLFGSLLDRLRQDVTGQLAHVQIMTPEEQAEMVAQLQALQRAPVAAAGEELSEDPDRLMADAAALVGVDAGGAAAATEVVAEAARDPGDPTTWGKVGRNEKCPCGSGKKYKQCHGRI